MFTTFQYHKHFISSLNNIVLREWQAYVICCEHHFLWEGGGKKARYGITESNVLQYQVSNKVNTWTSKQFFVFLHFQPKTPPI